MPISTETIAIIDTVENMVAIAAAGRLTGVSTTVQNTIHTYDQDADAKIDALQALLDRGETADPMVEKVLAGLAAIAKASGFTLPTEDRVFAGVKAAVDDLAGSLTPVPAAG